MADIAFVMALISGVITILLARKAREERQHAKKNVPVVDDGFGSVWEGCDDSRCDIQVVRPGKVQCSNYCGRET